MNHQLFKRTSDGNTVKIIAMLAVPFVVVPIQLLLLATDAFSGALQTFLLIMLITVGLNAVALFAIPDRFKYTQLFSWIGLQIGLVLHILAQYRGSYDNPYPVLQTTSFSRIHQARSLLLYLTGLSSVLLQV